MSNVLLYYWAKEMTISFKFLIFILLIWIGVVATALIKNQPEVIDGGYIGAALFWLIAPPFVFFSIFKYVVWIVRGLSGKTKQD